MTALPQTVSVPIDDHIRVGVATFLVNSRGEFLIGLRKSKHGHGTWGLTGGHVELGETHVDAAIRESAEETGIQISRPQMFDITSDMFPDSGLQYLTIFMVSRVDDATAPHLAEPDKFFEWKWVSPENVPMNLMLPLANLWHQIGGADGFRARLAQIA